MTHTTSEILDLAADDIQRNGWAQGPRGMTVDGSHCALGAIASSIGARPIEFGEPLGTVYPMREAFNSPAGQALIEHLSLDTHVQSIAQWNDAPNREGWEVTAALRAAAAIERVKETSTEKVPA